MTAALNRAVAALVAAAPDSLSRAQAVMSEVRAMLDEHLGEYDGLERGYASAVLGDFWRLKAPESAGKGAPMPPERPKGPVNELGWLKTHVGASDGLLAPLASIPSTTLKSPSVSDLLLAGFADGPETGVDP